MGRFGTGQAIRRVEDLRFLRGQGRYTDDVTLPNQAVGYVLRSPYAHCDITTLDVEAARGAPGVLGVFTCADLDAAGIGALPVVVVPKGRDGQRMAVPPRPALARGRARHVGEPVAFIVAETLDQAKDAADLIVFDADPLDAVTDMPAAVAAGAPPIWPDLAPDNVLLDWEMGDAAAVATAFAQAARVVRLDLVNNRVAPVAMETRGAIGDWDGTRMTLITGSQGSHQLQGWLCDHVFKTGRENLHVIANDVGGGFGMRLFLFPEHVLVLFAARALGRPVKWIGDRAESFLGDTHGRDHISHAEAAVDADGRILGLKVETLANLGAYVSQMGAFVPTMAGTAMLTGVYAIPCAHARVRCVVTNTAPTDAYRGAGRPEAAYLIERLVDTVAREMDLPREEVRRRNFIPPSAMPYRTALGKTYDTGEFARLMDDAMARADWAGFEARRAEAKARGKLRGIGMSYYVEVCGGGGDETAHLHLDAQGKAVVLIGTQSTGQGHETAYGHMVAAELGIPLEDVRVVQGDTDLVPTGKGTGGSRSLPVGGSSLAVAVDKVITRGKAVAAQEWGVEPDAVDYEDGRFRSRATNQQFTMVEVAALAGGIREQAAWQPPEGTYPNGCHICELEIDPDTGETTIARYTVTDDVGIVINPLLLRGQIVGGVAQSVGQALFELAAYDSDSGQLLAGTFMDYAMPRADTLPHVDFKTIEIPCTTNLLGVKGAGEAGTIGATPAVINAVVDALAPLGVTHVDMPATPHRLWRLVQSLNKDAAA
ncbi:xanthine dehydrogenase family protein molybdopterin-binding subunit [Novispirillum sp. DQ9]|uniref:xanthine dehydrogenase family protein molybdopterin-binding subunit n=1 Tax=Novispirillum sp. DQ9 TaxID=3398612 RepID=UPI003C7E44DF